MRQGMERDRRQGARARGADAVSSCGGRWAEGGMGRLQAIVEGISRVGAIVGGALLLIAALIICVDITLRYAISKTLGGADELSGYALAIASAWGFSAALLTRSHIRIDTVYVRVRSRVRATLDLLSLVTFASFFALISWHAWGVL